MPALQVILAEVLGPLGDHSSLFCSSHKMFHYVVDQALHNYLCPLFDAVRERIATFLSVWSSQEQMHGQALPQNASSIISLFDEWLYSSGVVSRSGELLPVRSVLVVCSRRSFCHTASSSSTPTSTLFLFFFCSPFLFLSQLDYKKLLAPWCCLVYLNSYQCNLNGSLSNQFHPHYRYCCLHDRCRLCCSR